MELLDGINFNSLLLFTSMATGLFAGVIAGLFGVGGGIIIVPALLLLFHFIDLPPLYIMQMAVGTSLATIIITNLMATFKQQRRQSINWLAVSYYTPGVLCGAWLGAQIAVRLDGGFLQTLFGIFLLTISYKMIRSGSDPQQQSKPIKLQRLTSTIISMIIGAISSLFGIGGGSLSVPALNLLAHIPIRVAVGSSSAIGIFLAIAGVAGFIQSGSNNPDLPPGTWGYIVPEAFVGIIIGTLITTPIGVKLAHTLPPAKLSKSFGIFLLLVGFKLIVD
ncbi:MAG: sulfite exporter TauE/SafE family protein [Magnetococcales bacterium]|nr:sulfite exporter TauE/SafE family protein [Magnetococcales bacterium]